MPHRATLTYSEPIVVRAVLLYWRRTVGIGLMVVVALMIVLLAWMIASGDRSWVVGVVAAVVMLGVLVPVLVYVVHFRNSTRKFREMQEPVAEFVADDDAFTLSSDLGSTTLKWNMVTELWRYDALWLLLFSKAQFVTVPLDGVPEHMRSFVMERIKASGGKISV
jgi:Na+/melibiose symporter-like transporter